MGGALQSPGNVAPHSEFNFFVDPDAARAVVRSGAALSLVPLDATRMAHLSQEEMQQQRKTNSSPAAQFCEDATRVGMAIAERMSGGAVFYLHDPLAVATTKITGSISKQRVSLLPARWSATDERTRMKPTEPEGASAVPLPLTENVCCACFLTERWHDIVGNLVTNQEGQ